MKLTIEPRGLDAAREIVAFVTGKKLGIVDVEMPVDRRAEMLARADAERRAESLSFEVAGEPFPLDTQETLAKVRQITSARNAPMESAVRTLLAMGYRPDALGIAVYDLGNGNSRDVLSVRGVEAFEVVTTVDPSDQLRLGVTVTSRILTWPEVA